MLARFLLLTLVVTLVFSLAVVAQEVKKETKKEMAALKSFSCADECGFMVHSRDEKEVTDAVIAHAKKHHNMMMSESDVKGKMKTVSEKKGKG